MVISLLPLYCNIYRKDLANIVRRRGHKLIKELLADSAETSDQFDSFRNLNDDQEETGQFGGFVF